ncbi:MAG: hypothetical protein KAI17_08985, partial [Thiotrichaceae bacterium]|nr:hypothetical protein [Thiotrichaceae bacterium]
FKSSVPQTEIIVSVIATIHAELLLFRQLYIPITEKKHSGKVVQGHTVNNTKGCYVTNFINHWRNNMKTLTCTVVLLSFALSAGSAYATKPADTQHYNDFYPESHNAGRLGSQPEVGSVFQQGRLQTGSGNFWKEHGELLDRFSNMTDSSNYDQYAYENGSGRTGSQPEIGSVSAGDSTFTSHTNFWAENEELMYRNNPLK